MKRILAALAGLALLSGAALAQEAPPRGVWTTESGNFDVAIAPCGGTSANALCGDVVAVHANRSMAAPGQESAAPARVGLRLLSDLRPASDGRWRGKLYNRENGRTYDCVVTPRAGALEVRGYVVLEFIGQSQTWRRAAPAMP